MIYFKSTSIYTKNDDQKAALKISYYSTMKTGEIPTSACRDLQLWTSVYLCMK